MTAYTNTRAHTASRRKSRLENFWSTRCARLGGVNAVTLPELRRLHRYIGNAPYMLPSREWYRFRKWMRDGND